jgi:Trypsin-like serine proteases, typically periplasmic, contain C-terminal PDZ domain
MSGFDTTKGDFGSPVINSDGKVIGIITARQVSDENIYTYAIPISESYRIIESLLENKPYPHRTLGITGKTLNKHQNGYSGVLVSEVYQNTPAEGKIQIGDIIKKINNTEIFVYQDLGYELFKIGELPQHYKIQILRDNILIDVDLDI